MRNVQSNASRGGEFADGALASSRNCSAPASQLEKDSAVTKPVTFSCWLESALASGCDGGAVFFGDTAQQVLLAQQPDWQAFWLGALERMHDRAARPTGAVKSAAAIAIEIIILLSIDLRIAQVRPRVEESVQRLAALTRAPARDRGLPITSTRCFGSPLQRAFGQSRKLSRLQPICYL